MILKLWCKGTNKRECYNGINAEPLTNITRFEQKGLISLKNLIGIAMALEYTSEIRHIFSQPKYSTMEELQQIKRNANKKKAHRL